MIVSRRLLGACALLSATMTSGPATAQSLTFNKAGYFETRGVNYLVFSNWYDGLFSDAKISGLEIIHHGNRIATNGDVRLSATPGQWDPIGRMIERKVDPKTGAIDVLLEYPEHNFRYRMRGEPRGKQFAFSIILDQPLPAALSGKAGFNLEFKPAPFFHKTFIADGKAGTIPLHPTSQMIAEPNRQPSSGRDVGPGAEPLPLATGKTLVLAPEDADRRVTIRSTRGGLYLYDGRNQAQNGWFVVRSPLPSGQTGTVVEWLIEANSVAGWVRPAVIGHSQLGYAPEQKKTAVIERDPNDRAGTPVRLVKIASDGRTRVVKSGSAGPWGKYLRYNYSKFDFSEVKAPGVYRLESGPVKTATFRIDADIYADAWHPAMDVYMPVQMDHMLVNEAYRVWHGDPHRDDARQAPVNHEHIDLWAQGPTTDTRFVPGEHIPGLNVGGFLDAGDFDQRTSTQYGVIRSLVDVWERGRPARDATYIDPARRRVEMHVPDGKPDILQQIEHGIIQLVAQQEAIGFAIHGITEPDVAQYTHLGDAGSKTDGLVFDPKLKPGEELGGRSGTPDDRWAFTSRASGLNYGSAAAFAAASRAFAGYNNRLAARTLQLARKIWADEQSHAPFTYSHGNTTGGPLEMEQFTAAVELLITDREPQYAATVQRLWPIIAEKYPAALDDAMRAVPHMPPSYRDAVRKRMAGWKRDYEKSFPRPNPYGVQITEGGWAGNGQVMQDGLLDYWTHKIFPDLSDGSLAFTALDYLHGTHPGSDISFVSAVGTRSKEVAYGSNRADFSYIAGGVVPGVLVIKPDLPENSEDWPFFWGQNEYVVNMSPTYVALVHAAMELLNETRMASR